MSLKLSLVSAAKPEPAYPEVSYGPNPNQVMDVYLPKTNSEAAVPVLIWYGTIWKPGRNAADPNRFLSRGIAVIAAGTRTMTEAHQAGEKAPVSYVMNDACRVVQFVRLNAEKWGVNPNRIAVGGGSQGSLPALYAGCAQDHADPSSQDPVERLSSRVTCVAAYRSQPSIDPVQMQAWVPGVIWGAPALGMGFEESLKRRAELLPLIRQWSPESLLSSASAPIYFEYNWGLSQPDKVTEMDYKVHSPAWALGFQKKAREAGATCLVKYPDHLTEGYQDIWDFIVKQLQK